MSTIKVLNMAGAEVGTVELKDSIFGIEPNESVVHEVVKNHLANCRQGTQSALTRAEVSGGGKKPWRLALKSALSAKAAAGEIIVVDSIKMDAIKTKDFRTFLGAVKAEGKALVITPAKDEIIVKSARNIPGVETAMANLINVYDILKAKNLVIDKEALAVIEEVFA